MSNPAVLVLETVGSKEGRFRRFAIEDNIGESIHLHVDDMRIDFTIEEFLEFASLMRASMEQLNVLCGYPIGQFDAVVLRSCARWLPRLAAINIEEVQLSALKGVVRSRDARGLEHIAVVPVQQLPAYAYLEGEARGRVNRQRVDGGDAYRQHRLRSVLASLRANPYPVDGKYIVVFNGQNYIRGGEEYAAALAVLHGVDVRVNVMRFCFRGTEHFLRPFRSNAKARFRKMARSLKR